MEEVTKMRTKPPFVLSKEQIKWLENESYCYTIEQISEYLGCCQSTFYKVKSENVTIEEAYRKGRIKVIDKAKSLLWEKMHGGDTASIIFFLKTQAGWREQKEVVVQSTEAEDAALTFINED